MAGVWFSSLVAQDAREVRARGANGLLGSGMKLGPTLLSPRYVQHERLGLGRLAELLAARSIDVNRYATAAIAMFVADRRLRAHIPPATAAAPLVAMLRCAAYYAADRREPALARARERAARRARAAPADDADAAAPADADAR